MKESHKAAIRIAGIVLALSVAIQSWNLLKLSIVNVKQAKFNELIARQTTEVLIHFHEHERDMLALRLRISSLEKALEDLPK